MNILPQGCQRQVCNGVEGEAGGVGISSAPDAANYSLQDARFFNGTPVTVVVTCPPGAVCSPDDPPIIITYPPETFVFPDVPLIPGQPIVLSLQGCISLVSVTLPAGSSAALIQSTVNSIIQQVANQQAQCDTAPPNYPFGATLSLGAMQSYACLSGVYSGTVQATANPPSSPIIFSTTGTLPPGITLFAVNNTQAFFVGTPTTAGAYTFTVNATAQNGITAARAYTINVVGITTTSPLPDATIDEIYSESLAQAGMTGTLIWGIGSGSLPVGLAINSATGEISGTPTVLGSSSFTVFVQNATQQCSKAFAIEITTVTPPTPLEFDWSGSSVFTNGVLNTTPTRVEALTGSDAVDTSGVILYGFANYTGPGGNYKLVVNSVVVPDGGVQVRVDQDAVGLIALTASEMTGPFPQEFPFTLIAGVASLIECVGNSGGNILISAGPSTASGAADFEILPA